MTELARLGLYVDSSGVVRATKELRKLEGQGRKTEKTSKNITNSFAKMKGAIAGLGIGLLVRQVLEVNRRFESLQASLETATGSAENAKIAFAGIQQFAAETPYSVDQVTNAFIRLANLGLAPTERALTSYGNIAGAMSKNIIDFVEAVADATTGEFERLKEFGIKASKEGDKVSFRFRGITTEIGNNASEIQEYLIGLGETEFAGGMERQAATLNGAISNLGDAWDAFIDGLLDQDNQSKITRAVRFITTGVEFVTDMLDGRMNSVAEVGRALKMEQAELAKLLELQNSSRMGRTEGIIGKVGLFASDEDIGSAINLTEANINRLTIQLRETEAEAAKNKSAFDELANSLNTVSNASTGGKKKLTEQEKAAKKLQETYRNLTTDLTDQLVMLGMTEREAFIYEAQIKLSAGATDAMRDSVSELAGRLFDEQQALEAAAEATEERSRVLAEGASLTEAMLTPQEAYLKQLERIDDLLDDSAITEETAARARQKAFEDMKDAAKKNTDEMTVFMEEFAKNTQNLLADNLFDFMQGEFEFTADSFKRMLDRMVAEAIAADLASKLFDNKETGEAGLLSKGLGWLGENLNFGGARAEGGPVTSGKTYLVGERGPELFTPSGSGSITPNNQLNNNITLSPVYHINSNNPQQVRATVDQANKQLLRQLQHAQRNM